MVLHKTNHEASLKAGNEAETWRDVMGVEVTTLGSYEGHELV